MPAQGWADAPGWTQQAPVPAGAPPTGGYAPPAWRPPAAQPGIIPLRPLNLGEILDGAFRAVRANPAVMFGLTLLVITASVLVQAVLVWYVSGILSVQAADLVTRLDTENLYDPAATSELADLFASGAAQVVAAPVISFATTVLTGLLVVSVSRSVLGRKVGIGEVLRSRQVWSVLGFSVLTGIVVTVAVGLLVGAVVALALVDAVGAAALVGIVGGLALAVGLVWFGVRTLLVTPALMLEGKGFWSTVTRAWRLTRGSFWRLLGIWLLTAVIVGFIAQVIQFPVSMVVAFVFAEPVPTSLGAITATSIGQVLAYTLSTVFTSAVVALLYIDTRMRREGLDIELARAAQQPA